jgi:PTS system nitrogen regulatory IIA component
MPREEMDEKQVAAYLHMDMRELLKLASRGQIPCRKGPGGYLFRKGELDHWVEEQIHEMPRDRLAKIEQGVSKHHGFESEELLVAPLIPQGGIAVPLAAKTRDSALRGLVDLADQAGLVYSKDELLDEIRQRELLCSTAIAPGVALPHPRHPLPWDIEASFVTIGLAAGAGVPFGAIDGSLTRLLVLICCKDERTHLHVLARLAQMFHDPATLDEIFACQDAAQLRQTLERHETQLLHRRR